MNSTEPQRYYCPKCQHSTASARAPRMCSKCRHPDMKIDRRKEPK